MRRLFHLIVLAVLLALPALPQYDTYGGWNKLKGQKTGFFHLEKIAGRWWLVTPDGNAFFSKGVCNINARPENPASPPAPADLPKWASETARLLKGWNFNTAGAWSAPQMSSVGLAYTPIVGIASSAGRDVWLKGGIPDYFSPEFRAAADRAAAARCKERAHDPWLLGYFTDNELRWGADWRSKESLLETYLKMAPGSAGYQKAIEFLKSRGSSPGNLTEEDKSGFVELAAAEYARISRDSIRRYDPNHLVIGCRFAGYATEPVLRGMGPYYDVISYNSYQATAPVEKLRQIYELTGKPTMITEFSFKAMDSGLPNTRGAAKPVATQQDRAEGFTKYVEALAALPSCVGFHWFEYRDQPKEGRFDGENSNYGLVKIDLTPWTVLTSQMTKVNARLEDLAARSAERRPLIGAEIMDDPAANEEKVAYWIKTLADHQMPVARVFIPRGENNLKRMDWFFRAAEKYHVGITATLGGQPSPENAQWIADVVKRYKDSPALDSWILTNEPGNAPQVNPLALEKYRVWLKAKYKTVAALNEAWRQRYTSFDEVEPMPMGQRIFWSSPGAFIDWYAFWRSHLTYQLNWIAEQIRKLDTVHPTHTNPAGLVSNLAGNSQDLPAWRPFLTSIGGSAHPSWHFTLLRRDQYALGVAYISDLLRGAIEPKPFWITELQAGNNLNSGNRPLYPMPEDVAQWMWTALGSGADRIVFWLLNNRSYGTESGEWSLLDFQDQPSERLETAARVARIIEANRELFQGAQPVDAPVTILVSLETMTLQERFSKTQPVTSTERGTPVRLEARDRNAHLLAALAYYEVLHDLGIPVHIKHIHDFDFAAKSARPRLAILPNLAALTGEQAQGVETFVRNGNTALITGLTGVWDQDNRFWALSSKFPLENLLGATIKEFRTLDDNCNVRLRNPEITLPSHVWVGEIRNMSAEPIASQNGWITGVRKRVGSGEAIWIPSLVDLGAWVGDKKPLTSFVAGVAAPFARDLPFRFSQPQPGAILRVLANGNSFITVITNGEKEAKRVRLSHPPGLSAKVLWGDASQLSSNGEVSLGPRGTLVAVWR